VKPSLSQIASPTLTKINHPGVSAMRFTDGFAHTFLCLRDCYEVCVVGHQAIGPDFNATSIAPLCHQVDVLPAVIITKKSFLSAIPPAALYDADIRGLLFVRYVP